MKAMGADEDRVLILKKVDIGDFNLSTGVDYLIGSIKDMDSVSLIVIDTLDSFLGEANTNNSGEVRNITTQLSALAEEYNTCVLGISHLNKDNTKNAIHRVAGSISWVGAGRFNWVLAKDKDTPSKRLLAGIKNNHGKDGEGYSFHVKETTIGADEEAGKPITGLVLENWEPYSGTAQKLLEAQKSGASTKTGAAEDMILALLAMGRMGKDNLETIIQSEDISPGTLRLALKNLKDQGLVDKEKDKGVHGSWYWELRETQEPKSTTPLVSNPREPTPHEQRLKQAEDRRKVWALEQQRKLQAA
jgi:hypothetical protein